MPILVILLNLSFTACDDDSPSSDVTMIGGVSAGTEMVATSGLLRLDQPLQSQVLNTKEVVVQGSHPSVSEVIVNDQAIPVMNQRFMTTITLEEGPQLINVKAGEDQLSVNIFVDVTPPILQITEPAYGSHVDSAQNQIVTVIGSATDGDGSGIETVLVNGQEVLVEANGRFQYNYMPEFGLNRPVAIAKDYAGHESSSTRGFLFGRFKQWGTLLSRSVRGEFTDEALDVLAVTIENAIKSGIINDLVLDNIDLSQDFTIEEVLFQDVDVQLEPSNGFINLTITLYDLRIFFELDSPSTRGDLYISPATLTARLNLIPKPDGTLDANVLDPMVDLQNFRVYVDNGFLDAAVSFFEGYISNIAEELILSALDEALIDRLISPNLFSPVVEVLGVPIRINANFQDLRITPESIQFELGIQLTDLPAINQAVGYLYLPSEGAPPRLVNMASGDMHINALYSIFSHLWYGGLLNFALSELIDPPSTLSAALLNGFTDGKLVEYMAPTEIVGVRLRPMLPPIARYDLTKPNAIAIDFVDLHLDLTLPTGENWFTIGLDVTAWIIPRIIDNRLVMEVDLAVDGVKVDEPLFPVRSADLIPLVVNLIQNLPNQLGTEGISTLFDLNEIDFYGLELNSGTLQWATSPAPYLQLGIDLNAMIRSVQRPE